MIKINHNEEIKEVNQESASGLILGKGTPSSEHNSLQRGLKQGIIGDKKHNPASGSVDLGKFKSGAVGAAAAVAKKKKRQS